MSQTVGTLLDTARYTVGMSPGEGFPSALHGGLSILNEAGGYLAVMHEWLWMRRQAVDLGVVKDQDFISLPLGTIGLHPQASSGSAVPMLLFVLAITGDGVPVSAC